MILGYNSTQGAYLGSGFLHVGTQSAQYDSERLGVEGSLWVAGTGTFATDSAGVYFGAGQDAYLQYDGSTMKLVTDAVAASDFDVDCGTAKMLRLVEPVYIDLNFASGTAQKPASSAPGTVTFLDNLGADTDIATVGFAVGEHLSWVLEYNHQCVTNGSLQFHVHFQADDAPSGTDYVNWQIDYCIVADGETCPPVTPITTTDVAIDTQYEQVFAAWTTLTGINLTVGDQIRVKLSRIAAAGDAYAGELKLCTFGAHVQVDTLGSRTVDAK